MKLISGKLEDRDIETAWPRVLPIAAFASGERFFADLSSLLAVQFIRPRVFFRHKPKKETADLIVTGGTVVTHGWRRRTIHETAQ